MVTNVLIAVRTLVLFIAPITAGLLLTTPSGLALHSASAYTMFTVAVVHVIVTIVQWRPLGGSPQPILYAALFLALTLVQVALGIAGVAVAHVPLGVLMFGLSLVQLSRARTEPGRPRPERPA
ncbi:hypothetical protein GT755_34895 [Herbidospora sp. NEAU-GS84]|uniref:Uncharacterized protein n=1 Tax=Herbidospora solisilvae TaxID=2696284 RepID=A0A7C9JJP7_9ACTN|nr:MULTISPECIES: hypothetical protein [Herbidospora]NAS26843.1 hypothetical protein [Herbidospora solisilvae]GLX99152.1 hypothetical protein Hesp01_71020 [Herbidospora sp. NBRC 101105]